MIAVESLGNGEFFLRKCQHSGTLPLRLRPALIPVSLKKKKNRPVLIMKSCITLCLIQINTS